MNAATDDLAGRNSVAVTLFEDRFATTAQRQVLSLTDLCGRVLSTRRGSKGALPWWKLATFGDERSPPRADGTGGGSLRWDGNVASVTGVEFDYDGEMLSFDVARTRLSEAGVLCVLYTSPSHSERAPRWRILAPFLRPVVGRSEVMRAGRIAALRALEAVVGAPASPESSALSQSYYYGAPSGAPEPRAVVIPGRYVDTMASPDRIDPARTGSAQLSARGLPSPAERLRMLRNGENLHPDVTGLAMRYALKGIGADEIYEILVPSVTLAERDQARIAAMLDGGELQRIVESAVQKARSGAVDAASEAVPLELEPASAWAQRDPPPAREWVWDQLIPAGRVTALYGPGGIGKSTLLAQLGVHVSRGTALFGRGVTGGPVVGIFCEDERDEIERRVRAVCYGARIDLGELERLYSLSREGDENLLCYFEAEVMRVTPFYRALKATVEAVRPRLLMLDTAADLFGGQFMSTPQVRQFIKTALGGLCKAGDCAVVLAAHPSAMAQSDKGDGAGFSVAWNNSVRSRLNLRKPNVKNKRDIGDRRVLAVMKANYAPTDQEIPLLLRDNQFIVDDEPLDEAASAGRIVTGLNKLSVAALDAVRALAPGGAVVMFGEIKGAMLRAGTLRDDSDASRKALNRALGSLDDHDLIARTQVPRGGYRLIEAGPVTAYADMTDFERQQTTATPKR
jgi:hypothetical protein